MQRGLETRKETRGGVEPQNKARGGLEPRQEASRATRACGKDTDKSIHLLPALTLSLIERHYPKLQMGTLWPAAPFPTCLPAPETGRQGAVQGHRASKAGAAPACPGEFTSTLLDRHTAFLQGSLLQAMLEMNVPGSNDCVYIFGKKYSTSQVSSGARGFYG